MHQQKYIHKIIGKFRMQDANTAMTPMTQGEKLSKDMSPTSDEDKREMENIPYQSYWLSYASCGSTVSDISHSVSVLSHYNSNFGKQHWVAAKRILRYLKGTEGKGLMFKRVEDIIGCADVDWGSNDGDRKSYTGFAFVFGNAALICDPRKQRTVALSEAANEVIYT